MKNLSLTKKILLGLVVLLLLSQFIPMDKTNPPVKPGQDFFQLTTAPAEIANLVKGACYDCHSHNTKWPWYTNISPVNFWIRGHIRGGRQHLNFSEWASYPLDKQKHKMEEAFEEIEEEHMPLKSYTWLHPEAKLSKAQRDQLVAFFKEQSQ